MPASRSGHGVSREANAPRKRYGVGCKDRLGSSSRQPGGLEPATKGIGGLLYLLWCLPAATVIALIASGRANALRAALAGTAMALAVGLLAAPTPFSLAEAAASIARGAWIGWIAVPYILGGVLFWQVAMRAGTSVAPGSPSADPSDATARRRLLFAACFIVGPFAEAATGFGIGMIGTMALVRKLGVKPLHLLAFSLLSQTMILWGAMGSGVIVGAAFAGTDPTTLALHSSLFTIAFHLAWLPLFWRLAERAGIGSDRRGRLGEVGWLAGGLGLVIAATALLGPEIAILSVYGPLIALRFMLDERPDGRALRRAARRILPFAALIAWLVATRMLPPLQQVLEQTGRLAPFPHAPAWSPLFHAGSWLAIAAILTGLLTGQARALPGEMRTAWRTGRLAALSVVVFSMMAELLSGSGIAAGLAQGLFQSLGRWAVVTTPFLAGIFGALTNSGNAANGLFMASQVSLATATGLDMAALVALQHMSGLTMSMFSPVRMAIVCGLAGTPGRERDAYRVMLPFALAVILVLLGAALLIATGRI